MPEKLSEAGDRAPDAWEPLIAIADVAGGDWPTRARSAALALALGDIAIAAANSDTDVELFFDISQILTACDAYITDPEMMKNKTVAVEALEKARNDDGGKQSPHRIVGLGGLQLTNALATFTERSWVTWNQGKPISPSQLARRLRPFGVLSQTLRADKVVFRGYPRDRLDDAIERYLNLDPPKNDDLARYNATTPGKAGESEDVQNVTRGFCNTFQAPGNPSNSGLRDDVTRENDKKGGVGGNRHTQGAASVNHDPASKPSFAASENTAKSATLAPTQQEQEWEEL
jgi:hypothetical protein